MLQLFGRTRIVYKQPSLHLRLTRETGRTSSRRETWIRTMSSFKTADGVEVKLPDGLSESQLREFKPWNNWVDTLSKSLKLQSSSSHPFHSDPYSLRSVTIQSYDIFGGKRLGFLKLTASVTNSAGEHLPGAALLRGPTVAMLVILIPDDIEEQTPSSTSSSNSSEEEKYVVLTVQPRVAAGSLSFTELPAGMVDDAGTFKGAAAKEIEEELNITIHEDDLICLSELAAAAAAAASTGSSSANDPSATKEDQAAAMFPSAGGCDEHVTIFSVERRIPRDQLSEWSGRLTGLREEGEKITLKLVRMRDLWKEGARDSKSLAAIALWEGLRREGKV